MIRSPFQVLRYLIQAAWRRRWLLIVPVLVMVPAGIAASKLMPQKYVTRSLLLLQESGDGTPLAREPRNNQYITNEERLTALRALLLSDQVLEGVAKDLGTTDPRAVALKVEELKSSLWLEGAGPNFLEIFQSGTNPNGLGKQLEHVIVRLVEALVPEQNGPEAIQLVYDKYQADLAEATALKVSLEAELGKLPISDPTAAKEQISRLINERDNAARELQLADAKLQEQAGSLGLADVQTAAQLDQAVVQLGEPKGTAGSVAEPTVKPEDVAALRNALFDRDAKARDAEKTQASLLLEQKKISDHQNLVGRLAEAQGAIEDAQLSIASTQKRLDGVRLSSATGVLRAPELIRIVDPPRDPIFPTRSPFIYFLASLAAGALLALGLATIAELLDTRMRDPEEFSEVAGAPVIARIGAADLQEA